MQICIFLIQTSDCDEFFDADEFDVDSKNGDTVEKRQEEVEDKKNGNIVVPEEEKKKTSFRIVSSYYKDAKFCDF